MLNPLAYFEYHKILVKYKPSNQTARNSYHFLCRKLKERNINHQRLGTNLQVRNFIPTENSQKPIIHFFPKINDYKAPKYPIILCHGLLGFDKLILIPSIKKLTTLLNATRSKKTDSKFLEDAHEDSLVSFNYWPGIKNALKAKDCKVIIARVPKFANVEKRSEALNLFIANALKELNKMENGKLKTNKDGKFKVNLIAHSMGGLDCRYLISKIKNKDYEVKSLVTVATPHHGSEMADYIVEKFNQFKSIISVNDRSLFLPAVLYQLTSCYMKYFNSLVADSPDVLYFSYASYFIPKWYNLFYLSWNIIYNRSNGLQNDGLVTTSSARWGEYLGTLANIDHLDIINWKNILQSQLIKDSYKAWFASDSSIQPVSSLDVLQFYISVTNILARKGL